MTAEERENAINLLDDLIGMIEDNQGNDYDFALKKGIEALKREPCEDAVSRVKAMEICKSRGHDNSAHCISELPSVHQFHAENTRKGHWIMTNNYLTAAYETIDYVKCSCCGEESLEEGDYCPNCGAEMQEVEE